MNKMVISNLVHRPLRTLISVFAISIEVTLILLIVGLCLSMLRDSADRQKGIGFDVMVSPPGSGGSANCGADADHRECGSRRRH